MAFEPLPDHYEALIREFPGVDVRRAALSDRGGGVDLHIRPLESGLQRLPRAQLSGPEKIENIVVAAGALDDVLPRGYVPHLIKIDVEGAEYEVMKGGIETITRCRPIVYFEHGQGSTDHYGVGPRDVYDLLVGEAGLRIFDVDGHGPYSQSEFEEVFTEPIWNFVART